MSSHPPRWSIVLVLAFVGCAANPDQLRARVATQNESARAEAERAFFARGYRPLDPPPTKRMLTLHGVNGECTADSTHGAADAIEVTVGETKGTTTFEAACALASRRQDHVTVRLAGETTDTLLTQVLPGYAFAVNASGKVSRYLLAPQVKRDERVFAKDVSCCCDVPLPPHGDATIEVIVGASPATDEVVVPYDITTVTACDPSAPQ